MFGRLDLGKKIATIELRRIGTQDHGVGPEGKDCLHSSLGIGGDLISRIAQSRDDLLSEAFIRLHDLLCILVHKPRSLGWLQTVGGFNSGQIGVRGNSATNALWLLISAASNLDRMLGSQI